MKYDSKNKRLLELLLQKKQEIVEGTLETKRSFFIFGSNLHDYSMNQLRTFDQWKEGKWSILSGEKAVFLLDNYSNPYSKRTALFDVSQTEGATIGLIVKFLRQLLWIFQDNFCKDERERFLKLKINRFLKNNDF